MSKHTATPWKVVDETEVRDRSGRLVAEGRGHATAAANAAHIVRCVNTHAQLVEALSQIVDALPTRRDWLDPVLERVARAALAAARGEA